MRETNAKLKQIFENVCAFKNESWTPTYKTKLTSTVWPIFIWLLGSQFFPGQNDTWEPIQPPAKVIEEVGAFIHDWQKPQTHQSWWWVHEKDLAGPHSRLLEDEDTVPRIKDSHANICFAVCIQITFSNYYFFFLHITQEIGGLNC